MWSIIWPLIGLLAMGVASIWFLGQEDFNDVVGRSLVVFALILTGYMSIRLCEDAIHKQQLKLTDTKDWSITIRSPWTNVCPKCKQLGLESSCKRVAFHIEDGSKFVDFYDSKGKRHLHDSSISVGEYRCTEGHDLTVKTFDSCNTCGWVESCDYVEYTTHCGWEK